MPDIDFGSSKEEEAEKLAEEGGLLFYYLYMLGPSGWFFLMAVLFGLTGIHDRWMLVNSAAFLIVGLMTWAQERYFGAPCPECGNVIHTREKGSIEGTVALRCRNCETLKRIEKQ